MRDELYRRMPTAAAAALHVIAILYHAFRTVRVYSRPKWGFRVLFYPTIIGVRPSCIQQARSLSPYKTLMDSDN